MKREIKRTIEFPEDIWRVKVYKISLDFETKSRDRIKKLKEQLVNEDVIIKVKNLTYQHPNKNRIEEKENELENEEDKEM